MMVAVMERTAEIGTLRALGTRRSGIVRQFMVEGLLLAAWEEQDGEHRG